MNVDHWEYPPSSSDPAVVESGKEAWQGCGLRYTTPSSGARARYCWSLLVNPQTSYRDAWTPSQKQICRLIALAAELRTVIAIKEVWNKFLLSPIAKVGFAFPPLLAPQPPSRIQRRNVSAARHDWPSAQAPASARNRHTDHSPGATRFAETARRRRDWIPACSCPAEEPWLPRYRAQIRLLCRYLTPKQFRRFWS